MVVPIDAKRQSERLTGCTLKQHACLSCRYWEIRPAILHLQFQRVVSPPSLMASVSLFSLGNGPAPCYDGLLEFRVQGRVTLKPYHSILLCI